MKKGHAAEQAVLGAALIDPRAVVIALPILPRPECFHHAHHRRIWSAVLGLHADGEPVDVVQVIERLAADGKLEAAGGQAYVGELFATTPSAANVEAYARTVAQEARRRSSAAVIARAAERMATDDPDVVTGELLAELSKAPGSGGSLTMADVIEEGFDALQDTSGRHTLLPTGIAPLDHMLGGLERDRVYVPAGRTGMAKSALVLASAHHLADRGHPVGVFSLEMPARELFNRLAAHRYGVNLTALSRRLGNILQDLDAAYQQRPMSRLPMYFDDSSVDLPALLARALEWHHRHGIRALFVDYIGLIRVAGNAPRNEKIGECSRAFKQLAKRLHIPVVIACQFNRDAEKDDRRPRLSDLRDSGSIEQDADVVIALNPTSEPDNTGRRTIELGVLKNRSGPTGWIPDSITFEGRTQRFISQAARPAA